MALPKLTAKQARFVHEYLVDLNATQAAIRAGYKPKNAAQTGAENLKKPQIQEALQEARESREKSSMITAEWVLKEISKIAENQEEAARDRLKALELIGKHLGMWEQREKAETQGIRVTFEAEMEDWSE
jgi:phage terminase small subunit